MPQLDLVIFAPLLGSLLLLTALLLPLASELLLLAVLGFRSRRKLTAATAGTAAAATPLAYAEVSRSGYHRDPYLALSWWRDVRNYRRALKLLLRPYDAVAARPVAATAPASGAALWHSIFRVLATSDHKLIGRMYLVFGFFSALVGSIL